MLKHGKARELNVHISEEQVLHFEPKEGAYFISWEADDKGFLSLESGDHKVLYAPGEWVSVEVDAYRLKKEMH